MNNTANREKLKMQTPNKTDENIQEIAKLFPHVMSEKDGKRVVDFDLLRQVLSGDLVEADDERYRLDWVGKKASLLKANTPITKTLRPCKEDSVDFENTQNLYIEGDNFEVLKLIQESYLNKIKMIYIDPPYNTGKDFVYRDNFTKSKAEHESDMGLRDEEENKLFKNTDSNGRFHSDWLSMMYERLLVSRDLLKEDGVIFISIDDNEVHNLRKICDEVFGEGNFVDSIIWEKKYSPQNDAKWLSANHDYVLIYAKNKDIWRPNLLPRTEEQDKRYKNPDNDTRGNWKSSDLSVKTYSPDYDYPITTPSGRIVELPAGRCWMTNKKKMQELINDNRIWFGTNGDNVPSLKRFLTDVKDGITPLTIWYRKDVGDNQEAKQELLKIMPENLFDTPKSIRLIKRMIQIGSNDNDIILDFFSGSATTSHSIIQYNAENNSNRKFILVQIPEKIKNKKFPTICEIGKERIRRAGAKILNQVQNDASSHSVLDTESKTPLDIGFRVLKIDDTNFKDVYYHPNELGQKDLFDMQSNIKEDRTDLDLLFQTMLDLGVELSLKITPKVVDGATIYMLENNELIACFADDVSLHVIEEIKSLAPYQIVLKDSCFSQDKDKINAVESLSKVSTVSVI